MLFSAKKKKEKKRKQMLFIKEYLITQSDAFNTLLILLFQQWVHLSIS